MHPQIQIDGRGPSGTLYIVATPIGNLEDITIRAIRILKEVCLIAAEDTRRTRILLDKYQIPTPLTSLYDQNEMKKSGLILAKLQKGEDVAYVSDAGTPGISDPGYILVKEAIARGIRVAPVPGSSALVAALSVSGLPMDSFVFLGFLPAKSVRRRRLLASLKQEERTLVFYESPRRLLSCLYDIEELLGEREVVVSREMTKFYEEFLRGPAGRLVTDQRGGDTGRSRLLRQGAGIFRCGAPELSRTGAAGRGGGTLPPGYGGPDRAGDRRFPEADIPAPTISLNCPQRCDNQR